MNTNINSNYHLRDRVALVTGGGSGIGLALTEGLLLEGAKVVIASRRSELLHKISAELNSKYLRGRVYPYVIDLRSETQTETMVSWLKNTFERVDLLINNAGIADHEGGILSLAHDTWDRVMETNVRSSMWLVQRLLPMMETNNFGDIINIASQAGKYGYDNVPAYCASKHALLGLMRSVDSYLQKNKKNIRILNLCPSLVDVENTKPNDEPKPSHMHVNNIVKTVMFALSLDRNVRLGDIDLFSTNND